MTPGTTTGTTSTSKTSGEPAQAAQNVPQQAQFAAGQTTDNTNTSQFPTTTTTPEITENTDAAKRKQRLFFDMLLKKILGSPERGSRESVAFAKKAYEIVESSLDCVQYYRMLAVFERCGLEENLRDAILLLPDLVAERRDSRDDRII